MALQRTVPAKRVTPTPSAAVASKTASQSDTVTTATLVRGQTYVWKNVHYKRNVPAIVDETTAKQLEDLYQEVRDADQEVYEKAYFDVQRNVPRPVEEVSGPTKRRISARRD